MDPAQLINPSTHGLHMLRLSEALLRGVVESPAPVTVLAAQEVDPVGDLLETARQASGALARQGIAWRSSRERDALAEVISSAAVLGQRHVAITSTAQAASILTSVSAGVRPGGAAVLVALDQAGEPWPGRAPGAGSLDLRWLCRAARMAMLEPASLQEAKDWIGHALQISESMGTIVLVRVAASLMHTAGVVRCWSLGRATAESGALGDDLHTMARRLGINQRLAMPARDEKLPLGLVSVGATWGAVTGMLTALGIAGRLPLVRLGMPVPVDRHWLIQLARQCEAIVVVEEQDAYVEHRLLELIRDAQRQEDRPLARVLGRVEKADGQGVLESRHLRRADLIMQLGGLLAAQGTLPAQVLGSRIERVEAMDQAARAWQREGAGDALGDGADAAACATLCPGCPQRDLVEQINQLQQRIASASWMLRHHQRSAGRLQVYGEAGCARTWARLLDPAIAFYPAQNEQSRLLPLHNAAGGSQHVLVCLDQHRFRGTGVALLREAQQLSAHLTLLVFDNQDMAAANDRAAPAPTAPQPPWRKVMDEVERQARQHLARRRDREHEVVRLAPTDRWRLGRLLEESVLSPGVHVILLDRECGDRFHQRQRAVATAGTTFGTMQVDTEVCEACEVCLQQTRCPGLQVVATARGPRVQTDPRSCVNDRLCERLGACPSFEQILITRGQEGLAPGPAADQPLAAPQPPLHAQQETWRCSVHSAGGRGGRTLTDILARAGALMGYRVEMARNTHTPAHHQPHWMHLLFTSLDDPQAQTQTHDALHDLTGSRLRPAVTSREVPQDPRTLRPAPEQVQHHALEPLSPWPGPGELDLLFSLFPPLLAEPDMAAAPMHDQTLGLLWQERVQDDAMPPALADALEAGRFVKLAVEISGSRADEDPRRGQIILLGYACQRGWLPVRLELLRQAMHDLLPHARWLDQAFVLGRRMAVQDAAPPQALASERTARRDPTFARTPLATFDRQMRYHRLFRKRRAEGDIRQARHALERLLSAMARAGVDASLQQDLALRTADSVRWDDGRTAVAYLQDIAEVFERDVPDWQWALTHAAIWGLAKAMHYKDEVYVARLLIAPAKIARDRRRHGVRRGRGDRLRYRWVTRPQIPVWGRRFEVELRTWTWQLLVMAHLPRLRAWLPNWHKQEVAFADWYLSLLRQCHWQDGRDYHRWCQLLRLPLQATGFRAVLWPRLEAARQKARTWLSQPLEAFEPPPSIRPAPAPSLTPIWPITISASGRAAAQPVAPGSVRS